MQINIEYVIGYWETEVNACNAWNYAGGISTKDCADNYAKAFQLLYQSGKKARMKMQECSSR